MTREYVTAQGDMWDSIAKKTLGSEYHMTDLIEVNPDYREMVIFPANVCLIIPELPTSTPQMLPPWKQGDDS